MMPLVSWSDTGDLLSCSEVLNSYDFSESACSFSFSELTSSFACSELVAHFTALLPAMADKGFIMKSGELPNPQWTDNIHS